MRLTPEQEDFAAAVRDFCRREVSDSTEPTDPEVYARMAELGWLGVSIPEAYGGAGGGMVDACLFLEASMRGGAPIGAYGTALIVAGAYERFGS